MAAPVYSFPLLPVADVVACLAELGVAVSEAQLAKPEPEHVFKVFEELVTSLVGVSREELQQPVFSALDALQFPELHEESIGVLAFTRHLYRLMFASGVHDFCLRDVHAPECKRLLRCLSAVLNFAKYREDKLALLEELQGESLSMAQRHAELSRANAEKAAELERLEAERDASAPVASQLECETRALEARIAALSEEAEVLAGAVRDAKAEGHDLAAAAAATKQQLAAARVEADGLRAQIVSAPEAVVTALAEVNGAVERARLRCADAEAKTREQLARADQLARLDKELRKAAAVAAEGCAAVAARKEASHVLKAARARLSENEAEGWRLVSEKEHLQRTLATVAERQARLEQQGELKREAAAAALRAAEGEAAAANARSDSSASRVAENTAAARQLEAAQAELRRTHTRDMASVTARYNTLLDTIHDYHCRLAETLDGPIAGDASETLSLEGPAPPSPLVEL